MSRRTLLYGSPVVAGAAIAGAAMPGATAMAATGAGADAVSPKSAPYNAVGDGIADDTAAINQCLVDNRVVDFGGLGTTYRITDTIYVNQSEARYLVANGATIKADAAVTMMRFLNAAHEVVGLHFDGAAGLSAVGLIIESTSKNSVVESCSFVDIGWSGVIVEASFTKIASCAFRHCGHRQPPPGDDNQRITLRVDGADHCTVVDNTITDCNWGISFRGSSANPGISYYACRGNTVIAISPPVADSQGISTTFGRQARIDSNTIVGFGDNSIDCHGCSGITIAGNTTTGGKDGVFVGDENSSNVVITGNVFTGPQRGVRIWTSTDPSLQGRLVASVTVVGNTVAAPIDGGIQAYRGGANQISGITITGNTVHGPGTGAYGISITGVDSSKITHNQVYRIAGEGVWLNGTDMVEVADNIIQDAGYTRTANSVDAIRIDSANRAFVRNNTAYGNARYAVSISGGVGMTVTGTRWRSLATGGVNNGANGTVLSDNLQL